MMRNDAEIRGAITAIIDKLDGHHSIIVVPESMYYYIVSAIQDGLDGLPHTYDRASTKYAYILSRPVYACGGIDKVCLI